RQAGRCLLGAWNWSPRTSSRPRSRTGSAPSTRPATCRPAGTTSSAPTGWPNGPATRSRWHWPRWAWLAYGSPSAAPSPAPCCSGDPHAGRLLGELKDHLAQRDHLAVGFVASAIDVMLAIRAGRFADAEALAAVCASRGAAAGDADHAWWSAAQLVTIRWYQGRLTELLPMLDDRVHSPVLSAVD